MSVKTHKIMIQNIHERGFSNDSSIRNDKS